MMSLGRMFFLIRLNTALPALRQSVSLDFEMAACAELPGKLIPSASIAEAMVLAVYIPPHEPGPGIAVDSTSFSSLLLI